MTPLAYKSRMGTRLNERNSRVLLNGEGVTNADALAIALGICLFS